MRKEKRRRLEYELDSIKDKLNESFNDSHCFVNEDGYVEKLEHLGTRCGFIETSIKRKATEKEKNLYKRKREIQNELRED